MAVTFDMVATRSAWGVPARWWNRSIPETEGFAFSMPGRGFSFVPDREFIALAQEVSNAADWPPDLDAVLAAMVEADDAEAIRQWRDSEQWEEMLLQRARQTGRGLRHYRATAERLEAAFEALFAALREED